MAIKSIGDYYGVDKSFNADESKEYAKYRYDQGDMEAGFTDPTAGLVSYKDVMTPGNIMYQRFNPAAQAANDAIFDQVQKQFRATTGADLRGQGLAGARQSSREGNSVAKILGDFGDLKNYVRFSSDYGADQNQHQRNVMGADGSFSQTDEMGNAVTNPYVNPENVSALSTNESQMARPNTPEEAARVAGGAMPGGNLTPEQQIAQNRLSTPEFAAEFEKKFGRTVTQAELRNYVDTGVFPTSAATILTDKSPTRTEQNTVKGYDTNNNNAEVWVPEGKYVPGVSLYPPGMSTDSLKGAQSINVPGITGEPGGGRAAADAAVAGAGASIDEIKKQLTPAETDAGKKNQGILDGIVGLETEAANRGADQLAMEKAAGLDELRKQVSSIAGQIKAKSLEYEAYKLQQEGKPITMASITGSIAQKQNQTASEILLLQAQGQMLQGQLDSAQSNINRAIDLKYQTIDAQLNIKQAQLAALQPTLNKEERVAAMAQQVLIDRQREALDAVKTEQKSIQGAVLDAIKAGVKDQNILSQIGSASTYDQALQLLGKNMPASATGDDFVGNLINKYPDAMISPTDTLAQAQAKLAKSKIYQEQVRGPVGNSGPAADKLTPEEKSFQTDLGDAIKNLASGGDWGQTWNYMKARYNTPNDVLDQVLHKEMYYPKQKEPGFFSKLLGG